MHFRVTKAVMAAVVVVGMAACTGEPNGPTETETATASPTPAPEVVAQAEELEEVLNAALEEVPDDVRALVRTASITCDGRTFEAPAATIRTFSLLTPEIAHGMVAAMERALEETGAGPIRFAIGSLSGNRATFDCALPTLSDDLAEMLTEGFRGDWVFTLSAPLTEGQALSEVAPEDRTLKIRVRTPGDRAGQILSKVPGAWEFGASAAETLGWDYATMEISGEWLIEGLVPLWPGTAAHDDFYDFWMSWSRYGAELVQTTTNAHPALTPNPGGGVDIHIEYLPVAEGLTEEQDRLLGIYVAKLEEMGLAPVNVTILEGAA